MRFLRVIWLELIRLGRLQVECKLIGMPVVLNSIAVVASGMVTMGTSEVVLTRKI